MTNEKEVVPVLVHQLNSIRPDKNYMSDHLGLLSAVYISLSDETLNLGPMYLRFSSSTSKNQMALLKKRKVLYSCPSVSVFHSPLPCGHMGLTACGPLSNKPTNRPVAELPYILECCNGD